MLRIPLSTKVFSQIDSASKQSPVTQNRFVCGSWLQFQSGCEGMTLEKVSARQGL